MSTGVGSVQTIGQDRLPGRGQSINGSEVSRLSVAIHRGKQADQERHKKVLYYRQVKKLRIRETAEATGYSTSQVCRVQALFRPEN